MRIREHIRLLVPSLALVAGVWLLRLIVSVSGVPLWVTKLFSVTVSIPVAVLLSVVLIHSRRFGGYASVAVASLLVNLWAQALITLSIMFSILTGIINVYSAPEFSPGGLATQWEHIHGHLTYGIGVGTLVSAAVGCLLLWLLRLLGPQDAERRSRPPI
jgi:hypothetical protein